MIYESRIILKRIQKISNYTSARITTGNGILSNHDTGERIDCHNDLGKELDSLIDGLIRDGYLIKIAYHKVQLTDKGLHPYKMKWETIKHFLFHSVAVPIAVSVVTTLITLCITA